MAMRDRNISDAGKLFLLSVAAAMLLRRLLLLLVVVLLLLLGGSGDGRDQVGSWFG